MKTAFRWNKPAIIGMHRINFIGSLVRENRELNLVMLKKLITLILKEWPDVEFMTSDELGKLIVGDED
jgi:hypothetical protein